MHIISRETKISGDVIRSYIKAHIEGNRRLDKLADYYTGEHGILSRVKDARLSNNRIVCNHAKYITDTATGYLVGNPVRYSGRSGAPLGKLSQWLRKAETDTQDVDLAKTNSVFGRSCEMVYFSDHDREKPFPRLAGLDPRFSFVVYDDSVEKRPVFGVYFYRLANKSYECYVSNDTEIARYKLNSGLSNIEPIESRINPFGEVNIIEYYNNADCLGDFEPVLSLIDAYNVLQSDRINDKEQFVKSILLIKGQILGDTEEEESAAFRKIIDMGLLMVDGDTEVEWLSRQLDETSVEILRKALEQDIHKFSNVPCLTDQNFGANASGVAMRYKLLGFEQMTKIKERYFKEGLKIRLRLFCNALDALGYGKIDPDEVEMSFIRSLPVNELEISQTINNLKGTVPADELMKLLPFLSE